jgi:hypothetical protein
MIGLSVNNELERICKAAVVAYVKVLSQQLLGMTEENHEKYHSEYPVYLSSFEPRTSRILRRSVNQCYVW